MSVNGDEWNFPFYCHTQVLHCFFANGIDHLKLSSQLSVKCLTKMRTGEDIRILIRSLIRILINLGQIHFMHGCSNKQQTNHLPPKQPNKKGLSPVCSFVEEEERILLTTFFFKPNVVKWRKIIISTHHSLWHWIRAQVMRVLTETKSQATDWPTTL